VLIMVVVDSPHMSESWGSTVAAPIFRAIATETISYLGLGTDKIASSGKTHSKGHKNHDDSPATPVADTASVNH